jgi:hypothetical protein
VINYVEKYGLQKAITDAGHWLVRIDDVWTSDDDVAVQAIIDGYNPLPAYKQRKIDAIKQDGLNEIAKVFPALNSYAMVQLEAERWQSLVNAAKSPTPNFTKLINIYVAAVAAIANVNAAIDLVSVDAVPVIWP